MAQSTFTIEADQWSEHGYIYRDGLVIQYETDRKEQTHMEFSPCPARDFISDQRNPPDVRDWVSLCLEGK